MKLRVRQHGYSLLCVLVWLGWAASPWQGQVDWISSNTVIPTYIWYAAQTFLVFTNCSAWKEACQLKKLKYCKYLKKQSTNIRKCKHYGNTNSLEINTKICGLFVISPKCAKRGAVKLNLKIKVVHVVYFNKAQHFSMEKIIFHEQNTVQKTKEPRIYVWSKYHA